MASGTVPGQRESQLVDHKEGIAGQATIAAPVTGAVLVAVLALGGLAFSAL